MLDKSFARIARHQMASLSPVNLTGFLCVVVWLVATPLNAQNYYDWNVPYGDWSQAANWWGPSNTVPTLSDDAYISNGGTATISLPGAVCNSLTVEGNYQSGVEYPSAVLMIGGGLTTANNLYVGYFGPGSFTQSAGVNTVSTYLEVGVWGPGSYILSGGVLSAQNEAVGEAIGAYNSTFLQSGGVNSVSGTLSLGDNPNDGPYTQCGGTCSVGCIAFFGGSDYSLNSGLLVMSSLVDETAFGGYYFSFNISDGTLKAGTSFYTKVPITLNANNGGATFDTSGNSLGLWGSLTGSGGLTLNDSLGTGTLVLGGPNSYTGPTTINAGGLLLANSAALGNSSQVTVASRGSLVVPGSGSYPGPVINSGNFIAVGPYAGPMSIGSYSQSASGALTLAINGASSMSFSSIATSGATSVAGSLNISLGNGYVPNSGDPFTVLSAAGSLTGTFNNGSRVVIPTSGTSAGQFTVDSTKNSVTLVYQPLLMLAILSADTYNAVPLGYHGYTFSESFSDPANGFLANDYIDGNQIVVAFRGTENTPLSNPVAFLKNWAANVSFTSSAATPALTRDVADAAGFVKMVEQSNRNDYITLTGHSLGGAIAQLVGEASGLDTDAFNAPGAALLYGSLTTALSVGTWGTPVPDQINTNYRLQGDQVSLVGQPIGNTVTLAWKGEPANALDFVGMWNAHSINNVVSVIQNSYCNLNSLPAPTPAPVLGETNYGPQLSAALNGVATVISGAVKVVNFLFTAVGGQPIKIDPSSGTNYTFVESAESPNLLSATLPTMPGVAAYDLRYSQNGVWSSYQTAQPLVAINLPTGVSGVEFNAIGTSGQGIPLPSFLFQATFASSGTVSATLTETTIPSIWLAAVSGNWSNSSAWTGGTPNADSAVAIISDSTAAPLTITLDAPQTVGTLVLGSGSAGVGYTIAGSGSNTLTFSNLNNNAPADISVISGSHDIDATVVLASDLVVASTSSTPWTLTFGTASSIADNDAGLSLTMSASNGTLILSGSSSYIGGTVVEAGTLIVTDLAALPTGSNLTVGGDAESFFAPLALAEQAAATPASVPEPPTLPLLAVAAVGLLVRRPSPRKTA